MNAYTSTTANPLEILQIPERVEREQRADLAERRRARDQAAVQTSLHRLVEAASSTDNLLPPMLDAIRAEATVGEVCSALRAVFGDYREPAVF